MIIRSLRFGHYLAGVLVLALLSSCGEVTTRPDTQPAWERATILAQSGNLQEAAQLVLTEVPTDIPESENTYLLAAEYALKTDNKALQESVLLALQAMEITSRLKLKLLWARHHLQNNNSEVALSYLAGVDLAQLSRLEQGQYHAVMEQVLIDKQDLPGALLSLAQAERTGPETEQVVEQQLRLLKGLSRLTTSQKESLARHAVLSTWLSLADLLEYNRMTPDLLTFQLEDWKLAHPDHRLLPETEEIVIGSMQKNFLRPSHIAVLLPQKGNLRAPALSIRDGLLAAWYAMPEHRRPELRFHDSSDAGQIGDTYRQAINEGADMVIGPLSKQALSGLQNLDNLPAPVLAMNRIESENRHDNLFSFALTPESDGHNAATRAWLDGYNRAIIFHPEGSWGERIASAFQNSWFKLNGEVLVKANYSRQSHDFSSSITRFFQIDKSKARHRVLQDTLGETLEYEPYRRQDVDFIFLIGHASQARAIRPQLQFHQASHLPVYTTSHAYDHRADGESNRDLEGVYFCDMPWMAEPNPAGRLSKARLDQDLPDGLNSFSRLYAMGIDSFNLLPHLFRLQENPAESLKGKTGLLALTGQSVERQLSWYTIKEGVPEPVADRNAHTFSAEIMDDDSATQQ